MKIRDRVVACVVTSLVVAVAPPSAANAGNFNNGCSGGQACSANNSFHYLSYHLGTGRLRQATENTRVQSYDTTDLTVSLSDDTGSDVIYYVEDAMPEEVYGQYTCVAISSTGTYCNDAVIEYHGDKVSGF